MTNLFKDALHLTRKDFKIDGNDVIVTNPNFNQKNGCLMIYAPWCPHCQMKDDFINNFSLDNTIKDENFKIAVADGNQPDMADITEKLGLKGFPTFYYVICNEEGNLMKEFDEKGNNFLMKMMEHFSN